MIRQERAGRDRPSEVGLKHRPARPLHAVGFDGLALNFVNYLDEIPYVVQEVLPRLHLRTSTPNPLR